MSSTGFKQNHNDIGYYIPVGNLVNRVFSYNAAATGATPQFSTATWAYFGAGASLSSINGAGAGILKDMGKTVVSSLRTFRKIQLVIPGSPSTFGVGGRVGSTNGEDYLTGYIELGFEGNGSAAPVAHFGR